MRKGEISSATDSSLSAVIPIHQLSIRMSSLVEILKSAKGLNIEIILVLDSASKTETTQLQNELRKFDGADIKIVRGVFGSAGFARNAGLQVCKSKWIAFWDSDDIPYPAQYLRALENVDTRSIDLIVGAIQEKRINPTESPRVYLPSLSPKEIAMYPGFTRFLYKSEYIQGMQFKSYRMGEDICFLSDVLSQQPRIKVINDLLYEYQVGRSFQSTQFQENFKDLLNVVNHLMDNSRIHFLSFDLNRQLALRNFAGYLKHNKKFLNKHFLFTSLRLFELLMRKFRIQLSQSSPKNKPDKGNSYA